MNFFRAHIRFLIKTGFFVSILFVIYFALFVFVFFMEKAYVRTNLEDILPADSAIIFGANLNKNGDISEILLQRLEAGRALYQRKLVPELVVSNTKDAAYVMRNYLVSKGVPDKAIFVDTFAERTPDSCRMEKQRYPTGRKVIFVSQGFHLTRLLFQCQKLEVKGIGLAAEEIFPITSADLSPFEKISLKFDRYFRESYLTWAVMLNIYR